MGDPLAGYDAATLRELAALRESRGPKFKDPARATKELVAMHEAGTKPTIGWYEANMDLPARLRPLGLAEDLDRQLPHVVAFLGRLCRTIPFPQALASIADDLLEQGVDPDRVREAFRRVLAVET